MPIKTGIYFKDQKQQMTSQVVFSGIERKGQTLVFLLIKIKVSMEIAL